MAKKALFALHGFTGPVPNVLLGASQRIEQRRLAGVRLSQECNRLFSHYAVTSTMILSDSILLIASIVSRP